MAAADMSPLIMKWIVRILSERNRQSLTINSSVIETPPEVNSSLLGGGRFSRFNGRTLRGYTRLETERAGDAIARRDGRTLAQRMELGCSARRGPNRLCPSPQHRERREKTAQRNLHKIAGKERRNTQKIAYLWGHAIK